MGGGADADFDSLIDLIQSTVAPESWADGGGEAEIRPYPNGVWIDPSGTLQRSPTTAGAQLAALRRDTRAARDPTRLALDDPRRSARLRCVSLVRLEREIAQRLQTGEPLDEAMLTLAGLRRAEYLFVYPATDDGPGDLAIAGPAGDWRSQDGRLLAVDNGAANGAVVRLDDLIELFRFRAAGGSTFGCTINPKREALAEAQNFISTAAARPLRPGQRSEWLEAIRSRVGKQDIEVFDIDPRSRVARVIVEADYHMKLIGMGLADGVPGVEGYLDSIRLARGESPPPLGVIRWWFEMHYHAIDRTADGNAYQLRGPGAMVLSENQRMNRQGERTAMGESEELTARFAADFSANFAALCRKHPVYAELRNVFDISLITTLIRDEGLADNAGWNPVVLTDAGRLPLPKHRAPKTVETVANHRVIRGKHIVAGVSGGVRASPRKLLRQRSQQAPAGYGPLTRHTGDAPRKLEASQWWWDLD